MAAETHRPDGQLSCAGLATCDVLEHDDDPDVSSVTVNATGNNTHTEYGIDFPTPSGNPTVGADLQEFRAGVEEFDSGQTGTPKARIELWENGVLVRAGTNVNVSVYAVLSFTWNANELATADGSLVQCKVIGVKSGGSPSARNTVRIGHIEWNAEVDAGGQVITVGLASETDSVLAVGKLKAITVGLVTETDTALTVGRLKTVAIGLVSETDTGLAVGRLKTAAIGLATETDSALALVSGQTVAVGLVSEMDKAMLLARILGLPAEADTGLSITRLKSLAVGLALETDTALVVAVGRTIAVGLPSETNTALVTGRLKARTLGLVSEADSALVVMAERAVAVGIAAETDSALSAGPLRIKVVGLAIEESSTVPLVSVQFAAAVPKHEGLLGGVGTFLK